MAITASSNLTTLKAVKLNSNKQRRRRAECLWKEAIYTNMCQHIKLNRVDKCVRVFNGATEATKFSSQHCYIRERGITKISEWVCATGHESERERKRERDDRNVETVSRQQPFTHYWAHRSMWLRWVVKQDTAHNKGKLKKVRGPWRCSSWNVFIRLCRCGCIYKEIRMNFIAEQFVLNLGDFVIWPFHDCPEKEKYLFTTL